VRRPRGEARSRRAGASRELAPTLESTSPSPTRAPRIRQDPDEARPHLPGQTPRNPATQPRPDRIGTPSHCPVRCTQVRPTACVKGTRAALASGHDPFQFSHAYGDRTPLATRKWPARPAIWRSRSRRSSRVAPDRLTSLASPMRSCGARSPGEQSDRVVSVRPRSDCALARAGPISCARRSGSKT
jgi:hypothetical protein